MSGDGRQALFSAARRRPGTLVVECEQCGRKTRVSYLELTRRMLPITAWVPWRRHSRYLRCPACDRRTWVAAHWLG